MIIWRSVSAHQKGSRRQDAVKPVDIPPFGPPTGQGCCKKSWAFPAVVAGILAGRGVTGREAALLLGPQPLDDPMALPDMEKAVARIEKAIEDGEHIAVLRRLRLRRGHRHRDFIQLPPVDGGKRQLLHPRPAGRRLRDEHGGGGHAGQSGASSSSSPSTTAPPPSPKSTTPLPSASTSSSRPPPAGDRLPDCAAVVNPHRREYEGF